MTATMTDLRIDPAHRPDDGEIDPTIYDIPQGAFGWQQNDPERRRVRVDGFGHVVTVDAWRLDDVARPADHRQVRFIAPLSAHQVYETIRRSFERPAPEDAVTVARARSLNMIDLDETA